MPPPPQTVVFDLGKVLLDFDFRIASAALAKASRLGVDEFQRVLDQSPLLHRYESGQITSGEFFTDVVRATGYRGSEAEFRASFGEIFTGITPMIALHAELLSRGVPTFIFSNTNEIAVETIRARFPFFHRFTGYVLSYEVGAMKPRPRIYDAVETLSRRTGHEILYLDDRAENIEAGAARGWQTLLHHDAALTPLEVRKRMGW